MKSYAFYDLIGVRSAMKNRKVHELLEKFWNTVDVWTNTSESSRAPIKVVGQNHRECPDVYCATFTDSAVMYTGKDHGPDYFFEIARSLKSAIDRQAGPCYVVISYAPEIAQSEMPALGGNRMSSSMKPNYYRLAGSGESWANMIYADSKIAKHREWHGKYSVYCVGKASIPKEKEVKDSISFEGLAGKDYVYAIE